MSEDKKKAGCCEQLIRFILLVLAGIYSSYVVTYAWNDIVCGLSDFKEVSLGLVYVLMTLKGFVMFKITDLEGYEKQDRWESLWLSVTITVLTHFNFWILKLILL